MQYSSSDLLTDSSKFNNYAFSLHYEKNIVDADGNFQFDLHLILHEYFHLVQYASTNFGLWMFINHIDHFRDLAAYLSKKHKKHKLRKPFNKYNKLNTQKKILDLYTDIYGISKVTFSQSTFFSKFVTTSPRTIFSINGQQFPSLRINAEFSNNGNIFQYELTPRTITEAYSKSVEYQTQSIQNVRYSKHPSGANQFEYYAIRIILEKFFPNISEEQVCVILHWSLNHIFCVSFFKDIVHYLSKKYGVTLPPGRFLSSDIFQNCYAMHSSMHTELLNELKKMENEQRIFNDVFLANILNSVYNYYSSNLRYLSNGGIVPCLDLHPFSGANKALYSQSPFNSIMQQNAQIIPIPLYFRGADNTAFTLSKPFFSNYFSVLSSLLAIQIVEKGSISQCCSLYSICNLPNKNRKCKKFLDKKPPYKKINKCSMQLALEYFQK